MYETQYLPSIFKIKNKPFKINIHFSIARVLDSKQYAVALEQLHLTERFKHSFSARGIVYPRPNYSFEKTVYNGAFYADVLLYQQ